MRDHTSFIWRNPFWWNEVMKKRTRPLVDDGEYPMLIADLPLRTGCDTCDRRRFHRWVLHGETMVRLVGMAKGANYIEIQSMSP